MDLCVCVCVWNTCLYDILLEIMKWYILFVAMLTTNKNAAGL